MSEEIPVPVSLRNIRIQQWVKETAAAQTNNRLSLWPQDTPRSLVDEARDFPGHIRENTLISSQHTVTQNSPRSPFCIAEDLSQDLDSGPEQGGSTRQQQDPDTPLLDNLTTPTTISPPNSALWPANLSLGRSIDKKDSPWDRLAQREKLMDCKPDDGECAVSGTSDKNTTVPPAPLCFRQERNEPCPRLDNLHQETESQRRKASYLLPLYSRPTSQPMDWNDGTDADRLREDIMTHGESSLLDQTVPLQIEESMGRRHFAQPQVIVSLPPLEVNHAHWGD